MSLKALYKNLLKEYGDDALELVGKNTDDALKSFAYDIPSDVPIDLTRIEPPIDARANDIAETSAYLDNLYNSREISNDWDTFEDNLSNGKHVDLNKTREYLSRLTNPDDAWRSKVPLQTNDRRLDLLYDRLLKQYDIAKTNEANLKMSINKPYKVSDLEQSMQEVEDLKRLLTPAEQLEIEF